MTINKLVATYKYAVKICQCLNDIGYIPYGPSVAMLVTGQWLARTDIDVAAIPVDVTKCVEKFCSENQFYTRRIGNNIGLFPGEGNDSCILELVPHVAPLVLVDEQGEFECCFKGESYGCIRTISHEQLFRQVCRRLSTDSTICPGYIVAASRLVEMFTKDEFVQCSGWSESQTAFTGRNLQRVKEALRRGVVEDPELVDVKPEQVLSLLPIG